MKAETEDTERANGHDGNGLLSDLESLPTVTPQWIAERPAWVRNPLQKAREVFLMVTKTAAAGKYSISQPLLLVCIGVLGTAFFAYWWRSTDTAQTQRDKIIVLETLLQSEREKNIDQDSKIDQARNFATIADKNVSRLEGKIDQFMQVYSIKNAAKANLTFDRE